MRNTLRPLKAQSLVRRVVFGAFHPLQSVVGNNGVLDVVPRRLGGGLQGRCCPKTPRRTILGAVCTSKVFKFRCGGPPHEGGLSELGTEEPVFKVFEVEGFGLEGNLHFEHIENPRNPEQLQRVQSCPFLKTLNT